MSYEENKDLQTYGFYSFIDCDGDDNLSHEDLILHYYLKNEDRICELLDDIRKVEVWQWQVKIARFLGSKKRLLTKKVLVKLVGVCLF